MDVKKYKWLVGSARHKKGDVVEMDEEEAKMRIILGHVKMILVEELVAEENQIKENEFVKKDRETILTTLEGLVSWELVRKDENIVCFKKKDRRKVLKYLPKLLEKGLVADTDKEIKVKGVYGDILTETKLMFV